MEHRASALHADRRQRRCGAPAMQPPLMGGISDAAHRCVADSTTGVLAESPEAVGEPPRRVRMKQEATCVASLPSLAASAAPPPPPSHLTPLAGVAGRAGTMVSASEPLD